VGVGDGHIPKDDSVIPTVPPKEFIQKLGEVLIGNSDGVGEKSVENTTPPSNSELNVHSFEDTENQTYPRGVKLMFKIV
jgi:hypothetical protein